jgi:hypothetical protein
MRNLLTATAAGIVLMAFGGLGAAQAQVAYTNSALTGCYSYMGASVDTESGALNRNNAGTFCFDGNGNLVGTKGTPGGSGHYGNTNGTLSTGTDDSGTYAVTNTPGDGMGTITLSCETQGFSINNVDNNGLAHGFQYILISRSSNKKCKPGPDVIGGTAIYQGPLN